MSDIITRLLLKTNEFDANLNKSKKSVNDFQGGIANMAKTAGAGIAQFAGGVGFAIGTVEAFNKTIGSTQTTGDTFAKIMDQSKASVDAFFTSIAMGDFSGFLSNLTNVINKSGDLSVLLDELATKSLFSNAELNTLMTSKKVQENIAKDKTKSDEERNAALSEARKIQIEINKLQSGLANTNQQSSYATLDSAIAKQGLKGNVARSTWNYALKESNRPNLINYANEYRAKSEKVDNAKDIDINTGRLIETTESQNLKRQLDAWLKTSNGRFAEFSYYFTEMDDSLESDLGKAIEMNNKANSMKGAISDADLLLNNADAKINGSYRKQNGGAGGAGSGDNVTPSGSLAYFDAEIAKKNKELSQATTMQARVAVQTTINELEARKLNLKISVDKSVFGQTHLEKDNKESSQIEELENTVIVYDNLISKKKEELSTEISESTHNSIKSEISKLKSTATEFNNLISTKKTQLSSETSETVRTTIESEIKELESTTAAFNALISTKQAELIEIASKSFQSPIQAEIEKLESTKINLRAEITVLKVEQGVRKMKSDILDGYNNNHRDDKGNRIDPDAFKNIKIPKVKSPISKKDIKLNNDYNESLTAMGDIMGSLSSTFDGNTASILQWGATLFATIGQAIPAIMGMIPAKKANAMASREEATAAALGAGAKSMEAHAGIPFAGIAIGLAGVASIIAVLSNMPQFATGGIVPGGSFAGDNVLARVNSGEMILNRVQQGNLFAALNSGVYGGITAEMVSPSPQYTPISRNIASGETNSKIELYGSVRVKGGDLEVALKNHTNKKSKVR